MSIQALAYVGIRSRQIDAWKAFAGGILGMQAIDRGAGALAFRMDEWMQRLVVADEDGETLAFVGWEVASQDDLQRYGARLEAAGVQVHAGTRALADDRFVRDLIWFQDPEGNRVELIHAPLIASDPFVPGRPIEGFLTGPLGMGHLVLHGHPERMLPFYRDLLDFQVSDYLLDPFSVYFLHVNGRHHSLALVGSGKTGIHHLMVEYRSLDDVGQGYDLAQLDKGRVAYTLGRHANDYMTSWYAHTPSDFFIESGWGGRQIQMEGWQSQPVTEGPSLWGHERLYLSEEGGRKQIREMGLDAARRGLRCPPLAECPWLYGEPVQRRS